MVDVALHDDVATIETIAVHPDAARSGVASSLLTAVKERLPTDTPALDAWTRDDEAANAWYRRNGFTETFRYLRVFATDPQEIASAITSTRPGLLPASGFFHADARDETELKKDFRRVHVCRRYVLPLASEAVRSEAGGVL